MSRVGRLRIDVNLGRHLYQGDVMGRTVICSKENTIRYWHSVRDGGHWIICYTKKLGILDTWVSRAFGYGKSVFCTTGTGQVLGTIENILSYRLREKAKFNIRQNRQPIRIY